MRRAPASSPRPGPGRRARSWPRTGGCSRPFVSPIPPPPFRDQIPAAYDATWRALIRALAYENVPLRAVAKDSGVLASDEILSPIGVYADCGRLGDVGLEGEATVTFTVFVQDNGQRSTDVQVNCQDAHAELAARGFRQAPAGADLPLRLDRALGGQPHGHPAPARAGVMAVPSRLPELIKRARRLAHERDRLVDGAGPRVDGGAARPGLLAQRPRRALGRPHRGSGAPAPPAQPGGREPGGAAARSQRGDRAGEGARGDRALPRVGKAAGARGGDVGGAAGAAPRASLGGRGPHRAGGRSRARGSCRTPRRANAVREVLARERQRLRCRRRRRRRRTLAPRDAGALAREVRAGLPAPAPSRSRA